jgi:hypothetical protein
LALDEGVRVINGQVRAGAMDGRGGGALDEWPDEDSGPAEHLGASFVPRCSRVIAGLEAQDLAREDVLEDANTRFRLAAAAASGVLTATPPMAERFFAAGIKVGSLPSTRGMRAGTEPA